MKLIKLLVTISIINVLVVIAVAQYISNKHKASQSSSPTPSALSTSPSPTTSIEPKQKPLETDKPSTSSSLNSMPTECVIQIDSVSYDITKLRKTHSGGDIFECGTDMSALFWNKHNQEILKILQQYKI